MTDFHLIGIDHRSTAAGLIDLAGAAEAELPALLARLGAGGIEQGILLATCDRLSLVLASRDTAAGTGALAGIVAERAGIAVGEAAASLSILSGEAAVRQLFGIAASLESRVPGEPHVLGQVKAAHRRAAEAGLAGPELEDLLCAAYRTAKRVRTETAIGEGPATLAAVAVRVARDIHGDLSGCAGLLVGTGDMGMLLAERLLAAGLDRLAVVAPATARAEAASRALGGHFAPWDDLDAALAGAEIIVTALGSGRYTLDGKQLAAILRRRRRRPIFVVDASVPTDVDPAADRLDGVFLYGLDDLERLALRGRADREAATKTAWRLVDEGVAQWMRDRARREAVPLVTALRRWFEAERTDLLAERPDLDAAEATRLLVNRLLHRPSEGLRDLAGDGTTEAAVRRLFGLERLDGDDG